MQHDSKTFTANCFFCKEPIQYSADATEILCQSCGNTIHFSKPVAPKSKPDPIEVVVTDIEMRFESMVVFMIKWAVAAIPAFVILYLLSFGLIAFVGGIF